MSKHSVRLVAKCTNYDYLYRMIMDVVVQDLGEGLKIVGGATPRCGYFGDLKETLNPFVFKQEQLPSFPSMSHVMDFGTDYYDDDYVFRHYPTNLQTKIIAVGENFSIMMCNENSKKFEEHIYQIQAITDILTGKPLET